MGYAWHCRAEIMASTDDQAYLDRLLAQREKQTGVRGTAFADQRIDYNTKELNEEIGRVRRVLNKGRSVRFASFRKGA